MFRLHYSSGSISFGNDEILRSLTAEASTVGTQATAGAPCFLKSSICNSSVDEGEAENELRRIFNKEWFRDMRIVGQFNLGFIICRHERDLFIIDQHAADEKHNFEDVTKRTELNVQRMVCPRQLDMSSEDELTVYEHLDAFR